MHKVTPKPQNPKTPQGILVNVIAFRNEINKVNIKKCTQKLNRKL